MIVFLVLKSLYVFDFNKYWLVLSGLLGMENISAGKILESTECIRMELLSMIVVAMYIKLLFQIFDLMIFWLVFFVVWL